MQPQHWMLLNTVWLYTMRVGGRLRCPQPRQLLGSSLMLCHRSALPDLCHAGLLYGDCNMSVVFSDHISVLPILSGGSCDRC